MNNNSIRGLKGTNRNCVCVALHNLGFEIPAGQDPEQMMGWWEALQQIRKSGSDCKWVVDRWTTRKGPRIKVRDFAKQHPTGKYFALVRGHACAIIRGRVFNCPRNQQVTAILEV
jgi:hypothetical protein